MTNRLITKSQYLGVLLLWGLNLALGACSPASFRIANVKDKSLSAGATSGLPQNFDGSAAPGVKVKANGSEDDITVPANTDVLVEWSSRGTTACTVTAADQPIGTGVIGSSRIKVSQRVQVTAQCQTPNGPVTDTIAIITGGTGAGGDGGVAPAASSLSAKLTLNDQDSNIEIPYEETVKVTWSSTGATECRVDPLGVSALAGSAVIEKLKETTKYILTCTNGAESTKVERTVVVRPAAAPIVDLKVNDSNGPLVAPKDTPLKVTWTSMQATACMLTVTGEATALSTALQGSLDRTALDTLVVYTLTCTGTGGMSTDKVIVMPNTNPTAVVLTANGKVDMLTVNPTDKVTLDWKSTNAVSCLVTPGNYTGTTGSQMVGPFTTQTTYTVKCEGPNNQAATDDVVITPYAHRVCMTLKVNGSTRDLKVPRNSAVKVSWTSTNASSCEVKPFKLTGLSGTDRWSSPLASNTTVELVCLDTAGVPNTARVNVTVEDPLPKVDLKANGSDGPLYVDPTKSVQLVWTTQNVTQCRLNKSMDVEPNGAYALRVTVDTIMELTCKQGTTEVTDKVSVFIKQNGTSACMVGINIKDGGSWPHYLDDLDLTDSSEDAEMESDMERYLITQYRRAPFHGVAICATSGSFRVYGMEVISQRDQVVGIRISKRSTCDHDVALTLDNPKASKMSYPSTETKVIPVTLKKGQILDFELTNTRGCADGSTRHSRDPLWSQVTPNMCLR